MRTTLIIAAIVVFANMAVPAAYADDANKGGPGCTIANVEGTYGYVGFGTVRAPNPLGFPPGTYSSVGTLTFDGRGNLLIVDTARIDDTFLPSDAVYQTTYTVDKQCVATFTITALTLLGIPGPHFKVIFVDGRSQIRGISLLPGATINYVNTVRIENNNGK